jgi:hypothetical protein
MSVSLRTEPGLLAQALTWLAAIALATVVLRVVGFVVAILWNIIVLLFLKRWFIRLNAWTGTGQLLACGLLLSLLPLLCLVPSYGATDRTPLLYLFITVPFAFYVLRWHTLYAIGQAKTNAAALAMVQVALEVQLAQLRAAGATSPQGTPDGTAPTGNASPQP